MVERVVCGGERGARMDGKMASNLFWGEGQGSNPTINQLLL